MMGIERMKTMYSHITAVQNMLVSGWELADWHSLSSSNRNLANNLLSKRQSHTWLDHIKVDQFNCHTQGYVLWVKMTDRVFRMPLELTVHVVTKLHSQKGNVFGKIKQKRKVLQRNCTSTAALDPFPEQKKLSRHLNVGEDLSFNCGNSQFTNSRIMRRQSVHLTVQKPKSTEM